MKKCYLTCAIKHENITFLRFLSSNIKKLDKTVVLFVWLYIITYVCV